MKRTLQAKNSLSELLWPRVSVLILLFGLAQSALANNAGNPQDARTTPAAEQKARAIPMDQLGAMAGKQYSGDGLAVVATDGGARLRCVFQRMEGEVSRDGLWLKSTVPDQTNDRFQVKAMAVGGKALPRLGDVSADGQTVRFSRRRLVEEYTVSMDGVRQDFVVLEKPLGVTGLHVELEVEGAKVEQTATGAQLVLEKSGRKIAYSRLKVTDAGGQELPARIEVSSNSALRTPQSKFAMAVVVDDADAVYPVRIDPTFSDDNWVGMSGLVGADSTVNAAVVDNSGNLYIGGIFTNVGTVTANMVAKWNGISWEALGLGVGSGYPYYVSALAVDNVGNLYVGGYFDKAGGSPAVNIAKWNGANWSALGLGWDSRVNALTVDNAGTLYAAGAFTSGGIFGGGVAANRIAKWDGTNWSALGSGLNDEVYALALNNMGTLYAGGRFTGAGGATATFIASWNGTSWGALGSGLNSYPNALQVDKAGNLYAGGGFTTAGGVTANRVAKWNGINWSALGTGLDVGMHALTLDSFGRLYAAGHNDGRVFKWDGFNWSQLGFGVALGQPFVNALAADANGNVFVGGKFTDGWSPSPPILTPAKNIVKWTGTQWSALGTGISAGAVNRVTALLVDGNGDLYAGGSFTTINGILANNIARWDGSRWRALGTGLGPGRVDGYEYCWVKALELDAKGNLYAGGYFQHYGGSLFTYFLSKWDGTNWSQLGTGLNESVYALASDGQGNLHVGGGFTSIAGVSANRIAKWDGSNWILLGTGLNNPVYALALDRAGNLYAGGSFTDAGGMSANRIAKWNGTVWSALGTGVGGGSSSVNALVIDGNGNLCAGGRFSSVGGIAATNVARWNGQWSALGNGVNSVVNALEVDGNDNVYACGQFTKAGGISANRIAKWDGATWNALGSGLNDFGYCAAVYGADLYVGGIFTTAGGKVSAYLAQAILASLPPSISTTNGGLGFRNGLFGFSVWGPASQMLVIEGSTNLVNWVPLQTNLLDGSPVYFSDPQSTNHPGRFYRLITP